MKTVNVNGKDITTKAFAAKLAMLGNTENLEQVAQAAAIQAAENRNTNWLADLFNLPTMRLKSGGFSALGKQVRTYIVSHTRGIKLTDKAVELAKVSGLREEKPFPRWADFLNAAKPAAKPVAKPLTLKSLTGRLGKLLEAGQRGIEGDAVEYADAVKALQAVQAMLASAKDDGKAKPSPDEVAKTNSVKPTAASKAAGKK